MTLSQGTDKENDIAKAIWDEGVLGIGVVLGVG